jgi:hypothetical protein
MMQIFRLLLVSNLTPSSNFMVIITFLLGMLCGALLGSIGVFALFYQQNWQKKDKVRSKEPKTTTKPEYSQIKPVSQNIPTDYLDKSTYKKEQQKLIRHLDYILQEIQTSQHREFAQLTDLITYIQSPPSQSGVTSTQPTQPLSHLNQYLQVYNQQPDSLLQYVSRYQEVVEFDERQAQRRRAIDSQEVILDQCQNGHFWVFQLPDSNRYYLVPNNLQINSSQGFTTKALFNGYVEGDKSNFTLINPAIVQPINERQWQLVKKGDLRSIVQN